MVHYVGVLDGSEGTWGVRIPDLPGCHGGGATVEATIADGKTNHLRLRRLPKFRRERLTGSPFLVTEI